ncbi:Protein SlyX homolog [uncultured Pleomorphomonas sp.]|uniref:Protein SlyX homolog n=2 Tax=Pleomorphomonas TaxID=261933 RepID=A0A2G9WUJ8_9HYPH|nr:SlyX family protein [Pleomorphomonas carboxyditropha]PIO98386.1 SlyX protein [Pleomorphomonas carboxyditropha]SCM78141.1 Protein SlyX homolog [uncultured Pleomorphomonas sp.]
MIAKTTEARIDALEEKIAYQDQVIEDLNTAVTDQWKEIDTLKRLVANLLDEVKEMELAARATAGREPPPPHY